MVRSSLMVVLVLMWCSGISRAASNFELIDSLCVVASQKICDQILEGSTVRVVIADQAALWLVRQSVVRACAQRHIAISDSGVTLSIGIADCATRYTTLVDRDSVQRSVRVELRAGLGHELLSTAVASHIDHIARTEIANAESPRYDFTTSAVPPPVRSTWDDILEPLIIIGALATTVVLLFSVRSQ